MRAEIFSQVKEIMKGNQLLCARGEAGRFGDMTSLLHLVGRNVGDLIEVPYYDVKQLNLWQDLFVWLFVRDDDLVRFFGRVHEVKAIGFPLYLQKYHCKPLVRTSMINPEVLRSMGSSYAALKQNESSYNEITIVPRFNVVEACATYYEKTGQWVDPYWLEQQSKHWATKGEQFVKQKALLKNFPFSFDLPHIREPFTFVEEQETNRDVD